MIDLGVASLKDGCLRASPNGTCDDEGACAADCLLNQHALYGYCEAPENPDDHLACLCCYDQKDGQDCTNFERFGKCGDAAIECDKACKTIWEAEYGYCVDDPEPEAWDCLCCVKMADLV